MVKMKGFRQANGLRDIKIEIPVDGRPGEYQQVSWKKYIEKYVK